MAEAAGRLCVVQKNGVTIAGVRDASLSVSGQAISTEDQGDEGIQQWLADTLTGRGLTINISGVEKDGILQAISLGAASGYFMSDITFFFPSTGATLSGDFVLGEYSETGPYQDAQTFTTSFTSDGPWTYTAA